MRELVLPNGGLRAVLDEIEEAPSDALHRGNLHFFRTYGLGESRDGEVLRAIERGRHVLDAKADRTNRGSVYGIEAVREALRFAVHHDVDAALLPTRDGLASMLCRRHEPERGQDGA